ncbi:PGPGW domain-containing protein [Pelagicoccus sp. SDUM812003]|nr:PGPGW domain-containing protein [Pelagicoccus sp. SDUM812003]
MNSVFQWIEANEQLTLVLAAASVFTFVASLIAVPLLIILMPSDFLTRPDRIRTDVGIARMFGRVLKNLLGLILLFMGLAMLVLPGQGLLTMLIGITLIDFPGKRILQIRILRVGGVRRSVSWIRRKAGKPPLKLPARLPTR